jgi:hypothetical protein
VLRDVAPPQAQRPLASKDGSVVIDVVHNDASLPLWLHTTSAWNADDVELSCTAAASSSSMSISNDSMHHVSNSKASVQGSGNDEQARELVHGPRRGKRERGLVPEFVGLNRSEPDSRRRWLTSQA